MHQEMIQSTCENNTEAIYMGGLYIINGTWEDNEETVNENIIQKRHTTG